MKRIDVGSQLMAHRNKQLEQQKAHEQRIARLQIEQQKAHEERIARMLTGRQGIWLSNRWAKILFVFLAVYTLFILFYVKFR